jgi:hypothetical protein
MRLILYCAFFLQAGLVKTCAKLDNIALKEGLAIEKGALKTEGTLLTKDGKVIAQKFIITKSEKQILEQNKLIYEELKSNNIIKEEFAKSKKKLVENIFDYVDKASNLIPDQNVVENNTQNILHQKVINEIAEGPNGVILMKLIIYKLRDDNFNKDDLKTILNGGRYDTLQFNDNQLFSIYFNYSNLFADNTLQLIAKNAHCDKNKLKEIELIADKKKINKKSILYNIINECN